MASNVTKRINGRDYRYLVESYRDPETNRRKQRWQYVGVVKNGEVSVRDTKVRKRITREDIVAATVRLLEFRAPKHLTVSVIAASAGASRNVFYRNFANADDAITEAVARIASDAVFTLPPLRTPRDLEDARETLRVWCKAYFTSVRFKLACERVLLQGYAGKLCAHLKALSINEKSPEKRLTRFFKNLSEAGLAEIEDPEALAAAIKGMAIALRFSQFTLLPGAGSPLPEYDRLYLLIERAVFGPRRRGEG